MIYVGACLFAAFWLLLWYLRRATYKRAEAETKNVILEESNALLSSTPTTDADLYRQLRDKAANQPADKG